MADRRTNIPQSRRRRIRSYFGSEANIIPKTCRGYLDGWLRRDFDDLGRAYRHLRHFNAYVNRWGPSNPRWLKMCLRALKLPGGAGAIREPYGMPPDAELRQFAEGLTRLGIPELSDLANLAGLSDIS